MYFSRLKLENWRNFRSVDAPLTERMFVVGPNASGKSNLLDVFRFLRDIAKPGGGLQSAVASRLGISKLRCVAARSEPTIVIDVEVTNGSARPRWRYSIGLGQMPRGYRQPILKHERVWKDGDQILDRPNADDDRDEMRLTQSHIEQINTNADFRELAHFFQSVRYLHLVPQLVRNPEAFQGPNLPDDPFGRNFLELIAKSSGKVKKSRLAIIEKALQKIVPQLEHLTETKDETGVPHLEVKYKHWRPQGARQREDQFSDGTLRLIALFWSLMDGEAPLLLEEPELSLHAAVVRQLPQIFHRIQRKRKRQLLVSTHSWELLSDKGIGGEDVLVLHPDVEGTTAETASSSIQVLRLLEAGLSVADAIPPLTSPNNGEQLHLEI